MKKPCTTTVEELTDLATDHLAPAAALSLRQHVETCASCQADLQAINRLLAAMRSDVTAATTAETLARRRQLFTAWQAQRIGSRSPLDGVVDQIRGVLQFDSRQRYGLAGARGGQAAAIKLLYQAGPYEVDLWVMQVDGNRRRIVGQVSRQDEAQDATNGTRGLLVQLLTGEREQAAAQTDHLGEFELPAVADGDYTLVLATPTHELVLPGLTFKED